MVGIALLVVLHEAILEVFDTAHDAVVIVPLGLAVLVGSVFIARRVHRQAVRNRRRTR